MTVPLDGGNDGIGRRSEDDPSLIVTHTLRAEGHDASEDGTGRGTPLVMPIQYVEQWGWDKRQNGVGMQNLSGSTGVVTVTMAVLSVEAS